MLIRPAGIGDVPAMYAMLRASADEQSSLDHLCVDEAALREDGFGASKRFDAIIAEADGAAAGLALYFFTYSTWTSRNGLYLEDLFVAPAARRRGVARALMKRLAAIAVEHGCGRLQWVVRRDNIAARRFSESIGAVTLDDWPLMWMTGASLQSLAG